MVATIGSLSGPPASVLQPVVQGAQVWVKYINAKGGLNGHQVRYLIFDDGSDPARHRAQVQEAIEQKRAQAILAYAAPLTGAGSIDYVTSKRVPVIGSEGGVNWMYSSPMYFPQMSSGDAMLRATMGSMQRQLVPSGATKLASLMCSEAQGCTDWDRLMAAEAKNYGFAQVYRGRGSLVQPDYTAECLAARNAGAQVFFILHDVNSIGRVASSCARQGYKPRFAIPFPLAAERFKDDPNLDSVVGSATVFPWFESDTPATQEFQKALKDFGNVSVTGGGPSIGWTAGKLLEAAGARLPEPPTSAAILEGLWSLKGDTLGNLTGPLTYEREKPAPLKSCWFDLALVKGRWASPDGFALHCL